MAGKIDIVRDGGKRREHKSKCVLFLQPARPPEISPLGKHGKAGPSSINSSSRPFGHPQIASLFVGTLGSCFNFHPRQVSTNASVICMETNCSSVCFL